MRRTTLVKVKNAKPKVVGKGVEPEYLVQFGPCDKEDLDLMLCELDSFMYLDVKGYTPPWEVPHV